MLSAVAQDRFRGRDRKDIARAFQLGMAHGLHAAAIAVCRVHDVNTVVLSGGVFQNHLLLCDLQPLFEGASVDVWTNQAVPPNDGGISLGQAALAAFRQFDAAGTSISQLQN